MKSLTCLKGTYGLLALYFSCVKRAFIFLKQCPAPWFLIHNLYYFLKADMAPTCKFFGS